MRPLLCSTVAEPTMSALCRARDEQARSADLVELRLDALCEPIDVGQALAGRTTPVIITCRPAWAGGRFEGSEEERHRLMARAAALGAEFVDVEWQAGAVRTTIAAPERVVLSMHDFDGVPGDLEERVRAMLAQSPAVVKVAVTARRLTDSIRLADLARRHSRQRLALIAMGPSGLATRVLPARFGSCWTYAGGVAPGQVPAGEMLDLYRFRTIGDATRVYGVAGRPVAQSLSPAMHNRFFEDAGIDAVYLPLDAEDGDDLMRFAEWLPLDGASVTAPLKTAMFQRITRRDRLCERVGAVNTIRRITAARTAATNLPPAVGARADAGAWESTNTDVQGFLAPLAARGIRLAGLRGAVLGAGGAARAVAVALGDAGARVSVHARRGDAADAVAAVVNGEGSDMPPAGGSWHLLVNATPVEWTEQADALLAGAGGGRVVYDLITHPGETALLRCAARRGYTAIRGVEMLVAQAEAQAAWWTGRRPAAGLMGRAAEARAKGRRCG